MTLAAVFTYRKPRKKRLILGRIKLRTDQSMIRKYKGSFKFYRTVNCATAYLHNCLEHTTDLDLMDDVSDFSYAYDDIIRFRKPGKRYTFGCVSQVCWHYGIRIYKDG